MKYMTTLILLIIIWGGCIVSAQNNNQILIGILRSDGIIIPFANYNNSKWSTPWPNPAKYDDYNIKTIDEIPPSWYGKNNEIPLKWFFKANNNRSLEINVLKLVSFDTHCQSNFGLLTDYPSERAEYSPYPKIGAVFNSINNVIPMVHLDLNSSETTKILNFIVSDFNKMENGAINEWILKYGISNDHLHHKMHPVSEEKRNKIDITIKNIYQSNNKISNKTIYYVEAQREYDQLESSDPYECKSYSYFNGFLIDKEGEKDFLEKNLTITDCDWNSASFITPFAIINVNDQYFIVVQNTYYESESYEILKIGQSSLKSIVSISGGGC